MDKKDDTMVKNTTLSTRVELGCWGYPAGDSLPKLNLTRDEIVEILKSHKDEIERMFESIQCGTPLHQVPRHERTNNETRV